MTNKQIWSWLNPLSWLNGIFSFLGWIFGPLLRALGYFPHPDTEGFENLSRENVDEAAKLAAEKEAAVDALQRQMSPAEVIWAYAKADAAGRAAMDLSTLRIEEQDWLLRLSDEDLAKLSMSTMSGCARSLEERRVLPIYAKRSAEKETPEIIAIPSEDDIEKMKRDIISARFRELHLAPGIANPYPKFLPTALH